MEKARKKTILVTFILIAASTFTIVAAQNGWFTFIYDPLELSMDDLKMTDSLELKDLPLWFEASVGVQGSGYTGQEHDVYISIFHTRPDNSSWAAYGDFALLLEHPNGTVAEPITSGSFSDLIKGTPYVNPTYAWTPGVEAENYTIALTIQNVYWIEVYIITATAGPGGSITPSGAKAVLEGEPQGFTITPDSGYAILDVLVDGTSEGPLSSRLFENVQADHTIHATFAQNVANFDSANGAFEIIDGPSTWGAIYANSTYEEALTYAYEPNTQTVNFTYTIQKDPLKTKGTFVITYRFDIERVGGGNRTTVVLSNQGSYDWSVLNDILTFTGSFTAPDVGDWSLIMVAEVAP